MTKRTLGEFHIIQALITYLIFVTLADRVYLPVVNELTNLHTTVSYKWTYSLRLRYATRILN
ncbi:hypothetical protein GCM10011384_43720 [Psychrobacillus lasiicapitis]|nr:hypothetical protein GCM10011384_43720 [Psychrobacillus lasiicapitis]